MTEEEFKTGKRADGAPIASQATIVMVGDPRLAWLNRDGPDHAIVFMADSAGMTAHRVHNSALVELRDAITAHLAGAPSGWPSVAADSGAKLGEVGR
jgi:hypothetical protein